MTMAIERLFRTVKATAEKRGDFPLLSLKWLGVNFSVYMVAFYVDNACLNHIKYSFWFYSSCQGVTFISYIAMKHREHNTDYLTNSMCDKQKGSIGICRLSHLFLPCLVLVWFPRQVIYSTYGVELTFRWLLDNINIWLFNLIWIR